MKKNIYIIMSEAEAPELEALLENAECDMPEGISAENITIKVLEKRKKAKARARALWLRFGAVAACLALIIAAVPTSQYILGTTAGTIQETQNILKTELGFDSLIGHPDSISYNYYFPLENGSVHCQEIVFKLENGKHNETWRELLAPFFEHCALDVSVANWELTVEGEKTESDGQTVTHTPGVKTLHLYFEGGELPDAHTLKCLVNTIDSITYAKYIKLYWNGAPVAIDGVCPEEGFINFH